MKRLLFTLAVMMVVSSASVYAQQVAPKQAQIDVKTTEAYSLLSQRKVRLQAQWETVVSENSSEWPQAKRLKFELDALKTEMKEMSEVEDYKVSKLTSGYGGLVLRKVALSGEIQFLSWEELCPKSIVLPSPRSGRVKIAQRFSAGNRSATYSSPRSGRLINPPQATQCGSAVCFTDCRL